MHALLEDLAHLLVELRVRHAAAPAGATSGQAKDLHAQYG